MPSRGVAASWPESTHLGLSSIRFIRRGKGGRDGGGIWPVIPCVFLNRGGRDGAGEERSSYVRGGKEWERRNERKKEDGEKLI